MRVRDNCAKRVAAWSLATVMALGGHAWSADEAQPQASAPAAGSEPAAASHEAAGAGGAADPDHAQHDPFNLTEANASDRLEDPVEWRYDLAICTLVVFLATLGVLWFYAWGPIMAGLTRRERAIAARIEDAQRSADEAAAQLQAYREQMAAASAEAQEVIAKARREGEAMAEAIRRRAQEDAARERRRAIAEIEAAKNAAVGELAQRGADMAVTLAGRIVQRELRPEEHMRLIADAIESFPSKN